MSEHTLDQMFDLVAARVAAYEAGTTDAKSRTHKLLRAGREKIAQKFGEEAVEVVIEAVSGSKKHFVEESADLLFFLILLWAERGVKPKKIWSELNARLGLPEAQERARRKA